MEARSLARLIDLTLLKPDATSGDIVSLCAQAVEYDFFAVCVNPVFVKTAARELKDSDVRVCTVVGFPLGANMTEIKVAEAVRAIDAGASEIDMVANIGALKEGDYKKVFNDISSVVRACAFCSSDIVVKVILETPLLTYKEKITGCRVAMEAGADFVKTATGFSPAGGATVKDVQLLRKTVGPHFGVKASGGIRSLSDALNMIEAGANRIGTSSGVQIIKSLIMKSM